MGLKLLLFSLDLALCFLMLRMTVTGRKLSRKVRHSALVSTHKRYAKSIPITICVALFLIEGLRVGRIRGFDLLLIVHISFGTMLLVSSTVLNWMDGFRSKQHARLAYTAVTSCVGTVLTSIPIVLRL